MVRPEDLRDLPSFFESFHLEHEELTTARKSASKTNGYTANLARMGCHPAPHFLSAAPLIPVPSKKFDLFSFNE